MQNGLKLPIIDDNEHGQLTSYVSFSYEFYQNLISGSSCVHSGVQG